MAANDPLTHYLLAIRGQEGSPAYNAKPRTPGGASGAYQFIRSTWLSNGGGQYAPEAYLASQAQQDAIASAKVSQILAANGNDPSAIPQVWYLGHVASPSELDQIPHPEAGNKLTVRQYMTQWLKRAGAPIIDQAGAPSILDQATSAVGGAVTAALGALVTPFVDGLKRLTITGLALVLGLGLIGAGAWRSMKAST